MNANQEPFGDTAELLGLSPAIESVRNLVMAAARNEDRVLLVGEAGVGKSAIARLIHERSKRSGGPFVHIDCRTVGTSVSWPDLLGEIQEDGTGVRRKVGALETVAGGTLFLSNLDALSLDDQKVFYSLLKSGVFCRGGENVTLGCRTIASMERDPGELISAGELRRDLYVLFGGVSIYIPPLRDRLPDLALLFRHLLQRYCDEFRRPLPTVPPELFESMLYYEWPGNVLELSDTVRNLVLMSPEGRLSADYLPFSLRKEPLETFLGRKLGEVKAELEKYLILRTLRRFGWNQAKTAKMLALSEPNLRYKMKKYEVLKEREGQPTGGK